MSSPALLNGVLLNLERSLFQDIYADVYGIDADVWRRDMDEMCQIGLRKVMLFTGIPFAVKTPGKASEDMLDFIYRECALRGMEVIIATGGTRTGLSNLLLSQKRQNLSRNTLTCFMAATVNTLLLRAGTLTMSSVFSLHSTSEPTTLLMRCNLQRYSFRHSCGLLIIFGSMLVVTVISINMLAITPHRIIVKHFYYTRSNSNRNQRVRHEFYIQMP